GSRRFHAEQDREGAAVGIPRVYAEDRQLEVRARAARVLLGVDGQVADQAVPQQPLQRRVEASRADADASTSGSSRPIDQLETVAGEDEGLEQGGAGAQWPFHVANNIKIRYFVEGSARRSGRTPPGAVSGRYGHGQNVTFPTPAPCCTIEGTLAA